MHAAPEAAGRTPAVLLLLRGLGALLLATTAALHGWLWLQGYDGIPVIGPAFLVDTALGAVLAVLVAGVPRRWLPWAAAAGCLYAAGTLAALLLSTTVGLFGFVETTAALLWWESFWIELTATVALAVLAVRARRRVPPTTAAADDPGDTHGRPWGAGGGRSADRNAAGRRRR